MPTGNAKFEAAANEASCYFLLAAGGAAAQFAAYSLLTGQLLPGATGAAVAGIAAYAYSKGCQWESAPSPTDAWNVELPCCPENSSDPDARWYWQARRVGDGGIVRIYIGDSATMSGSYNKGTIEPPTSQGGDGRWVLEPCGPAYDVSGTITAPYFSDTFTDLSIHPPDSAPCGPLPPPTPPDPYTYTDPDDGCQIKVTFEAWAVDGGGNYAPVFQMDPVLPAGRATGGSLIGGCNFNPVIYYDSPGGGGGGPTIPIPPVVPPGDPWWMDLLQGALGGLASYLAQRVLDSLFVTKLAAGNVTIRAACQYKEDGTPETFTVNFPEEPWADRVLTALDADVAFQQQFHLWKTPTCSGGGSSVTGEPVTITWRSDETSPVSAARVRKIFTYFDQSGTPQLDHVLHWENFTFQAGAVIVSVNGVPLGKPQVWAATADEGKRVINHAATIAGVDMSKAEWVITAPRSTRYGVPGTMRVYKDEHNKIWVTKRDGPSGPVGLYG